MADDHKLRPIEVVLQDFRRLSAGAWLAIAVLVGLLMAAIAGVYFSATEDLASGVSGAGVLAMTLGVLFTIAIGVGLMVLIFYSSRRGYDEPPASDPTDENRNN